MNEYTPEFFLYSNQFNKDWRNDPFWCKIYPKWAKPIFKEGIDVKTTIKNDQNNFVINIDAYQFWPEQLQVNLLDNTLLIEGQHEDVCDSNNYTKMYFLRKYELPSDVLLEDIKCTIDEKGFLIIKAKKSSVLNNKNERIIPIQHSSSNNSYDDFNLTQNNKIYKDFNSPNYYRTKLNSDLKNSNITRQRMEYENNSKRSWSDSNQTSHLNSNKDLYNNIYSSSSMPYNKTLNKSSGSNLHSHNKNESQNQSNTNPNSIYNIQIQKI